MLPRSITHRAEGWLYDGTGSIKSHPGMQWAYNRSALYLLMDRATLDAAGWSAFDLLDGDISAPECLPTGSAHRDAYKDFVWRLHGTPEERSRSALAQRLIDEILAELNDKR